MKKTNQLRNHRFAIKQAKDLSLLLAGTPADTDIISTIRKLAADPALTGGAPVLLDTFSELPALKKDHSDN